MARSTLNLVQLTAVAAAAVCCVASRAEPLTLTASHNLTHDSNFARTETPISDTINTTSLQLDLDKKYGRQTYSGSAQISAVRYNQYGKLLNNDAKDVTAGFSTELLSNWRVLLDGAYGESLNQFENNKSSDQVVRNIRTTKNAQGQIVYGVSGIWAVVGSAGKSTLAYSVPAYFYLNYRQDNQGLKAVYYSSDLLNYGVGVRHVSSQYTSNGERIDEKNLDLSTDWNVTGLSQLRATLSWTDSERKVVQAGRNYKGVTGFLNWNYTPHGLMSYGVSLYRTSNSDQFNTNYKSLDLSSGALTDKTAQNSLNNRTTSATAYARLAATAKLALTASTTWKHFNVDNDVLAGVQRSTSNYHSYSLNAGYAVERWMKLSAGVTRYDQSKDTTRNQYSGHAVNVVASFMLD